MAEPEKPQDAPEPRMPKRRSSRQRPLPPEPTPKSAETQAGKTRTSRPVRHHVKGVPERAGGDKPSPSAVAAGETKARGALDTATRFIKQVRTEFHRVTWPNKSELQKMTSVVIGTLVVLTLYMFVISKVFDVLFSRIGG